VTVLSYQSIVALCSPGGGQGLIEPYEPARVKPASYDISVGPEFHMPSEEESPGPSKLENDTFIWIAPNAICTILSEETLNMPDYLAAGLSLPLRLLRQGIIMAPQTQIDPGYAGKIVVLLYNLSSKSVKIKRGDHLVTIEFRKIDHPTSQPYSKGYTGLSSLSAYIQSPLTSSLAAMRRDLSAWQNRLLAFIPIVLTVLAVAVAILVAIAGKPILFGSSNASVAAVANEMPNASDTNAPAQPQPTRVEGKPHIITPGNHVSALANEQ
jgi:dCTP deaminase